MVAAAAHLKYLQAPMGHSIRVTLDLYGHLFPDANRGVVGQPSRSWVVAITVGEFRRRFRGEKLSLFLRPLS
jgi:hypothetical protein